VEVSVDLSKEQLPKANCITFGQLVRQRKIIFGGSKRRATEEKVL
jgi:hypothetical protein